MIITINDNKLKRALEDDKECKKRFGKAAPKIRLRIGALKAAENLAVFWPPKSGPERCHELIGDLKGVFSMDVKQPYRLLFKPNFETEDQEATNEAEPKDEKRHWQSIKSIEILRIEDTHA